MKNMLKKKEYDKLYYLEHKAERKEYREKNKEQISATWKKYYEKHKNILNKKYREERNNRSKIYYSIHKEDITARNKSNEDRKIYAKKYREEHKEKIKLYRVNYYLENKEKIKKLIKEWRNGNKDKTNLARRTNTLKNPLLKMKQNLGSRTTKAFKRLSTEKIARTNELLGTSYDIVKTHIEQQFKEGMTWQNYGEWHIDHIIPLASAKDLDELVALCHYSNLQPLWAIENMIKGNRIMENKN